MNYTTSKTANTQKLDYLFQYDYLNRLLKGVTFERTSPNHWNEINTFDTENSYDPNGNINTLKRYSNGNVMDNLFYNYNQIPPSNSPSNKLFQIHEGTTNANTTEDIKDQANPMNYDYDASGNLISDASEGIQEIKWTVDGKVKNIFYNNGKPEISYLYDASGNRIQKRVGIGTGDFEKTLIDYTIYARDANEQVMAIYERNITEAQDNQDPSISNCIKIRALMGQFDCEIEFTLCDNDYEIQSDGTLVSIVPVSAHCKNFPWVHVVTIPAGTKLLKYDGGKYDGKIPRKETGRGTYHSGGWGETYPDGFTRDGGISYLDIAGSNGPIPITSVSTKSSVTPATQSLMPKLSEWHIYGNEQQGRFVTRKPENEALYYLANLTNDIINKNYFRILDKKQYELKDHLGNVRVAIGDMKIPTAIRGEAPFVVDEKAVNDYYPYGMLISDRSWSSGSSRYGYNGKENDNEVKGVTGSQIDYGFRIYDPRIGKFLSVDPLTRRYPMLTPYQFASNTPIWATDLDGLERAIYLISINGNKIDKTKIELKENGDLGNGIAVILKKGNDTRYFYGTDIQTSGEEFTKSYEGLNLNKYYDIYNNPTIGYGHLINSEENEKYPDGSKIKMDEANSLFSLDYKSKVNLVNKNLKETNLKSNQLDALIDFAYNIRKAPERISSFNLNEGGNFFLGYLKGGPGLEKRRVAETLMFEDGLYLHLDQIKDKDTKRKNYVEKLIKENKNESE